MRKGFLILLAVVLVAALAVPAMAGTDINGLYRAKAWMSNFRTSGSAPNIQADAPTNAFVEQRLRLKFSSGEENVKAVAQFEIDFSSWGDAGGGSVADAQRNFGGALGADKINLETKNVYLWFKLPNTSLDFTVGLQGQSDDYAGLIFGGADMAGIFVTGKYEPVTYKLGWAKFYEYNSAKSDDMTLYLASVAFAPAKGSTVGVNFYVLQDDTAKTGTAFANSTGAGSLGAALNTFGTNKKMIYIPGVNFATVAGPATLTGFAMYQFGTTEYTASTGAHSDIDISGYALDLRGDMNVGPGKMFLEGLYISGGDNNADKVKSIVTVADFDASPGGNSAYGRTDMHILLNNSDDINCAQSLVGDRAVITSSSPANSGRGLWHIGAGYTQKLGDKLTGKVGLGYLAASNLLKVADDNRQGKSMGTEFNAVVTYNILKGLDFGLSGAYAWLGDFYQFKVQGSTPFTKDPDNAWQTNMRLNYAF